MVYKVSTESDYHGQAISSFEKYKDACEFAQEKYMKGYVVEIWEVSTVFAPKTQSISFEEVV